jgi:hypothetical protein
MKWWRGSSRGIIKPVPHIVAERAASLFASVVSNERVAVRAITRDVPHAGG